MGGSRSVEEVVNDGESLETKDETKDETTDVDAGETDPQVERPSRRRFFLGAAAAMATATMIPTRKAQAQRIQRPRPAIMTRPAAPSAVGNDTLARLVNRITLG